MAIPKFEWVECEISKLKEGALMPSVIIAAMPKPLEIEAMCGDSHLSIQAYGKDKCRREGATGKALGTQHRDAHISSSMLRSPPRTKAEKL